ncbi:MAG: hypothetical protein IPL59_26650 [Candidatus Competibacteraceae bacterium]|nr:hypothetical protein [Candidatus Competibacteraceae bacterium]
MAEPAFQNHRRSLGVQYRIGDRGAASGVPSRSSAARLQEDSRSPTVATGK